MNESLAKQLHKLISNTRWGIKEAVEDELKSLECDINNLIEENEKNSGKTDEQQ